MTRIANKLIQLRNSNSTIQAHLQVIFPSSSNLWFKGSSGFLLSADPCVLNISILLIGKYWVGWMANKCAGQTQWSGECLSLGLWVCSLFRSFLMYICYLLLSFYLNIAAMLCWGRRPTSLHDRGRDSDDDDYRDRDYDVAALANNLSQAFRYGIYSNDDIEEVIFWVLSIVFFGSML